MNKASFTAIAIMVSLSLLAGCKQGQESKKDTKEAAPANFGPAYGQSKPLYDSGDGKKK